LADLIFIEYYFHPYTLFGVLGTLVVYNVIYEARVDRILKAHEVKLRFLQRLLLFRIHSGERDSTIFTESAWQEGQRLVREYWVVNGVLFGYFALGIAISLFQLL
jgi:hypothetical protein